jgi:hypothetical protein
MAVLMDIISDLETGVLTIVVEQTVISNFSWPLLRALSWYLIRVHARQSLQMLVSFYLHLAMVHNYRCMVQLYLPMRSCIIFNTSDTGSIMKAVLLYISRFKVG